MNSSLGSNLSELDRLLLELNAVQQSTPAFATEGARRFTITTVNISPPDVQWMVQWWKECVFCNRRSSSSTALEQHHPPDPGEWRFFRRQDGATHTREAQTWSSRPSYRGRTAKRREPFGWAWKFCSLTNVSSKSLNKEPHIDICQ